jgi:hypothetical protein
VSPGDPNSPNRSYQEPVSTVRRHEQFTDIKLYNYNFLEKIIIRRIEKHFIKRLNIAVLDTTSIYIRICLVYTPHIIGLSLN